MNPSLIPIIIVKPPSRSCTSGPLTTTDIFLGFMVVAACLSLAVAIVAMIEWLGNRRN